MKKNFILFCLLMLTACAANTQKLSGVYVGAELYTTPFDGMQINNIVLYFRNDGTFSNALNKPGWQTEASGTYTIKNNTVELTFRNGSESKKYTLNANGTLGSTAGIKHTLHKAKKVTSIPAAGFESKSAATSGGMGTGMPTVGAFSSNYIYFDGKGNFSFNHSGLVGIGGNVSGGTIGGKTETNASTSGTYTLGDGEITLKFKNGKIAKHSFFYSPPGEEDLVVLDGEFYFREEQTGSQTTTNDTKPKETGLPAASDLLNELRAQYGGENIDKINTVKETATLTGNMKAILLTDLVHNKIRAEVWQQGKLLLVKQCEGNDGWQWMNGTKKPLTQDERTELQLSLYQGILGLHKKFNSSFQTGTVSKSEEDYMITFLVNGKKLVYLVGSDHSLKANAYAIHETPTFSVYKDFIKTNGITYPSVSESSDGKSSITATTTALEINPVLTDKDWKTP